MTTLYLKHEVRALEHFDDQVVRDTACSADELGLLRELIASRTAEDFDLGVYKDTYQEKLAELIEAKVEGKEIFSAPTPDEPEILNLMEALKKSVAMTANTTAGVGVAKARRTRSRRAPIVVRIAMAITMSSTALRLGQHSVSLRTGFSASYEPAATSPGGRRASAFCSSI